jgi:hypothetical protein
LIETSFSLNAIQSSSLLWRGDGVNDIVYNMVYDDQEERNEEGQRLFRRAAWESQEEPLWLSEASNYNLTSLDDEWERAFNMMNRYINEYKRVSTFGS